MRNYESRVSIIFLSVMRKLCLEILTQNWGERTFSIRQFGMRVYIRIVMITALE